MNYYSFSKFKFINFLLVVLFAVILEQKIFAFWGKGFNLFLISLVVLAMFSSYLEIIFLSLLGIFLINYAPQINKEVIFLFFWPQIIYFFSKKFDIENWISFLILSLLSFIGFYFFINFSFIFKNFIYFFYDFVLSFCFGVILFLIFKKIK
jgi:hypothetical protein